MAYRIPVKASTEPPEEGNREATECKELDVFAQRRLQRSGLPKHPSAQFGGEPQDIGPQKEATTLLDGPARSIVLALMSPIIRIPIRVVNPF